VAAQSGTNAVALRDLLTITIQRWRLVLSCFVLGAAAAVVGIYVVPDEYQATILVAPVSRQSNSGLLNSLSSAVSQIGGLGSLSGLSISGGESDKAVTIATLQSKALTEQFIESNNLLPILFGDLWDPIDKRWRINDPRKIPTLWRGEQYFAKHVRSVTEDVRTGLVTVTITWRDPRLAAQWANQLIKLTNDTLRSVATSESEKNIAYLNSEVGKTNVVQLRDAIYTLMENEIKQEMIARGDDQYALRIVDPAEAPERPASPRPTLWVIGGCIGGLLLGLLMAIALSGSAQKQF
jgi:uncharacterized protein involved in exopolysaccharide biosynthesis